MKYFAPGRVNLIGEHLDYNGGLVLPAALTIGITATYTPRNDNHIVLRSATHSFVKEISIDDKIEFHADNDWTNYPLGIIQQLKRDNHEVRGCEISFESNLPEGSGLSSSAAIEVLTAHTLLSQSESDINPVWLANFCRDVENDFIGVKCGIMDQYSVSLGKKENAILIDCAQLKHRYIPIELKDYRLIIMDTKKPRKLISSKYNERKHECEEALKTIRFTKNEIENLAETEMVWLDVLTDEVLKKRARHVLTENLRVKEAVKVLRMNDLTTFGRLLNASHTSLKVDYEVTGIELDTLVETAQQIKGCLGARMTGAGFGGCAIAIVHQSAMEEVKNKVSERYFAVTGINCGIYEAQIDDGVRGL
jgi:galactokinase